MPQIYEYVHTSPGRDNSQRNRFKDHENQFSGRAFQTIGKDSPGYVYDQKVKEKNKSFSFQRQRRSIIPVVNAKILDTNPGPGQYDVANKAFEKTFTTL